MDGLLVVLCQIKGPNVEMIKRPQRSDASELRRVVMSLLQSVSLDLIPSCDLIRLGVVWQSVILCAVCSMPDTTYF